MIIQAEFYLNPEESARIYVFDFDGDEIFHVDMQKKGDSVAAQARRLPSFEAQGALANMAVMKANLDIMISAPNNTPNTNGTSAPVLLDLGIVALNRCLSSLVCY